MIYASSVQLSVAAPFALSGKTTTDIQVEYNGSISSPVTLPAIASAPGILTALATGVGSAVALNEDLSLNTSISPAIPGSVVTLFATGVGQTSPPGEDGKITDRKRAGESRPPDQRERQRTASAGSG